MKKIARYMTAAALLLVCVLLCACVAQPGLVVSQGAQEDASAAKQGSQGEERIVGVAESSSGKGEQGRPAEGSLLVRFLDVGQGDAALVSCNGHHMLIDGGPSDQSSKIYAILKNLGITHLDAIIATHADADHIGGISGALNFAGADVCYCSVDEAGTKTFLSMDRYLSAAGCPLVIPGVGDSFDLGGARVTFVGPTRSFDDDNNGSLVCRIDFGETSFLFSGDAESASEEAMVKDGANLDADVLKVGHHGSKGATTAAYLKAVSPRYAVISVGKNSYGHPTDAALSRLEGAKATVLRTDELGTITFESDGKALTYSSGSKVTR